MTAPISQPAVPAKDSAAVRKRRRRAPAGGAADDCFTCTKRNVKCDRRRPYCSQCLEVSNECSGYKTQLTWNVGVASRGKLRGLSLPIAKAPPVAREVKRSPARPRANSSAAAAAAAAAAQWTTPDESLSRTRPPIDIPIVSHAHGQVQAASAPTTPYPAHGYDYLHIPHHDHHPHHMAQNGNWANVPYSPSIVHSPDVTPRLSRFPFPLVTDNLSSSIGSVGTGSDIDYMSPMSQSFPREELPFAHSPGLVYDSYSTSHNSPVPQSPPSALTMDHSRGPTSYPGLVYAPSEPSSSLTSHYDVFESHLSQKMMRESDNLSVSAADAFSTSYTSNDVARGAAWLAEQGEFNEEEEITPPTEHKHQNYWSASSDLQSPRVSQDLLTRMPFFMDYYEHTLCPSMVYIDGPANPFRTSILDLAGSSSSLRHAICALAACNLRMKRKLSLAQDTRGLSGKFWSENSATGGNPPTHVEDQSLSEEHQHRNLAVSLLNEQLNDASKATHDSVLATILLLCHYRMVESGVARFHTQFAGVKKILMLRRSQQIPGQTSDPSWMEALFTYFDAISASVNNRDAQLSTGLGHEDMLPPGAENLVGCDRELFKTISKLGRLNLLSQNKGLPKMGEASPSPHADSARCRSPFGASLEHAFQDEIADGREPQLGDAYGLPTRRFDGNGFGTLLDDDEVMASAACSSGTCDDHRTAFWREWNEARLALQNWHFDGAAVGATLPGLPGPSLIRDLGFVSEAFRYAALLYLERLANPNNPSTNASFQDLVSHVVFCATSLEAGSGAEKFLLWPLFVAGSECVNELQQNMVRSKCRDIMTRSGYMNNLAALDVLEKVWSTESSDGDLRSARGRAARQRSPFTWAHCIGGMGSDVEWIMF